MKKIKLIKFIVSNLIAIGMILLFMFDPMDNGTSFRSLLWFFISFMLFSIELMFFKKRLPVVLLVCSIVYIINYFFFQIFI